MSAEESKAVMRRFWEVWKQGNIDLLDELLAHNYINHTLATPDLPPGPEGVKEVVSMFHSAIPDLSVVIEDMMAEDDKVATRYALEGTHRGDLFGVAPTGRALSIKSMTVERLSGGKIVENWRVTDELDMMRQLGAIGAPESNPPSTKEHYSPSAAYSRAKLINLLWTNELARRLEGTGVTVNLADPGGASTQMTRSEAMPWIFRTINRLGAKVMTTEKAARSSIYLASSPEVEGVNGQYFDSNNKQIKSSRTSYDEETQKRIWKASAELTKLDESLPVYEGQNRDTN